MSTKEEMKYRTLRKGDKVKKVTKFLNGWIGEILAMKTKDEERPLFIEWQYDKLGTRISIKQWHSVNDVELQTEML